MNIIEAVTDQNLFGQFLGDDLSSWANWFCALKSLYGLPLEESEHSLLEQCTGRTQIPESGFSTALFLVGRRGGKGRMASTIASFEALFGGHEKRLSRGETGVVCVVSPTKAQSTIVRNYIKAVFDAPLLRQEIINETADGFLLRNNIELKVLAGDPRTVRGFSLVCAVVDEICFFQRDAEKVKSDTELVRSLQPGLATTNGKLVCISSPYSASGWAYQTFRKHHGNNGGSVLVWKAPSRVMNPTLPQEVVDQALEEDRAAARSEFLAEFRDDIETFIPRSVVERLVIPGRSNLLPHIVHGPGTPKYHGFCDLSGGRGDDATLCIGHREGRKVVVDYISRWKPPFSPFEVCLEMARVLNDYGLDSVVGDNYSANFVAQSFRSAGIRYRRSLLPASELYLEMLPVLCSGDIELPDHELLINQICSLERRTRSGGKDRVTHPANAHDDLANSLAGMVALCTKGRLAVVGRYKPGHLVSYTEEPVPV